MLINTPDKDKNRYNKIKQNIVDDWLSGKISDGYFQEELNLEIIFRERV